MIDDKCLVMFFVVYAGNCEHTLMRCRQAQEAFNAVSISALPLVNVFYI